jgi:23S rRNA pseudouridine2605 synthase
VASRRASEELIDAGRVEVNGHVVTEQGMRVDPQRDTIRVDGARVPPPRRHLYLVINKPKGVVATMSDPEGRRDLSEYVPAKQRLFHVGRLDTDTSGLLIMTNDGEFGNRLAHPKYEVSKTYVAEVEGVLDNETLKRLTKGIRLDDGWVKPDAIKLVTRGADKSMLQISLHEGRNRIVRRMMDAVQHPVISLSRIAIGPVRLGRLGVGESRELTREELGALLDLVGL